MKTMVSMIVAELAVIGYVLLAAIDFTGIASLVAAIGGAVAAIYAARANAHAAATRAELVVVKGAVATVKEDVGAAKQDIHKVEVATNSLKDALVNATQRAAMGEGELKGRADQKAETKQDVAEAKSADKPDDMTVRGAIKETTEAVRETTAAERQGVDVEAVKLESRLADTDGGKP